MAHTATVDLEELATLAGACNIAHAPDANDIAALHAQLASSLYHLSATHRPGVVPQSAFPALSTPTSSSMHRPAPWSSPGLEPHSYGWPSTPSASTSSSSSGTSFRVNEEEGEEEMMLDSPMFRGPIALFPQPSVGQSGGSGGRPCTPVLPATTTTTLMNTNLVHPNSTSHSHFQYHHSGHQPHRTLDSVYDPTATDFATSDPFFIDLQQQQQQQLQLQQQRSRTLQAIPLSFQVQGQAAGYSVQYAPLLRQNHAQVPGDVPNPNPPLSSSSFSNPYSMRPRY